MSLQVSALKSNNYITHKTPVYISTCISTQEHFISHIKSPCMSLDVSGHMSSIYTTYKTPVYVSPSINNQEQYLYHT